MEGVFGTITIEPLQQHLETFFRVRGGTISTIIEHSLKHKKGLKVQLVLKVELVKTYPATAENIYVFPFRSAVVTITQSSDLDCEISVMTEKVKDNLAKYIRDSSGWTFGKIEQLEIFLNQFKLLAGRSFIPLPQKLRQKTAIINVRNKDDNCFKWTVLSALHNNEVDQKSGLPSTNNGQLNFTLMGLNSQFSSRQ